jgi:hypothetical protein
MKAVYGYVRQVKKHLTTGEAIVEVQIPAEEYKEAVQLLDSQPVFVTVAGDVKGGYGVIDSEPEPEQVPKRFIDLRASAQAAIRCKEIGFQNWLLAEYKCSMNGEADRVISEDNTAGWLRTILRVKSRAELDVPGKAQDAWVTLNNRYWAEARYPDMA